MQKPKWAAIIVIQQVYFLKDSLCLYAFSVRGMFPSLYLVDLLFNPEVRPYAPIYVLHLNINLQVRDGARPHLWLVGTWKTPNSALMEFI